MSGQLESGFKGLLLLECSATSKQSIGDDEDGFGVVEVRGRDSGEEVGTLTDEETQHKAATLICCCS